MLGNLEEEMGDLLFRNIFRLLTFVTLPSPLQICTLSLKPGEKNPNMHMTFYKSALCALKILQFRCTAFICNQLEGFLINRSWRFCSLELSTLHEEMGLPGT